MSSPAIHLPMPFTLTQSWRRALPAFVFSLLWILFLYRDTAVSMILIWSRSETFTHGFLVLPIVLWLVWRKRFEIAVQRLQPEPMFLWGIACAAFAWLVGDLAAINALAQFAFVSLLALTVPTLLGSGVVRLIVFPLGFMFFSVPIGEFLLPQFMDWTANFTIFALRLSGIPVYREGLSFVIPSGSWSVVEACSGVRYLIASLTVGTLFAYLNYQSSKRRILFIIISIVVPVIANWMRAYFIVMLGHLSGNKIAVGFDHLIYGWIFFGVVILLMFSIGARWSEPDVVNVVHSSIFPSRQQVMIPTNIWISTIVFITIVTLPHVAVWAIDRVEDGSPVQLVAPDELAEGWKVASPGGPDFKPYFQNTSAEINSVYTSQGRSVGLYLGYYRHQNYEHKLISSNNLLVDVKDPRWIQAVTGSRLTTMGNKQLTVRTAELRATSQIGTTNEDRLTVWQIYWVNSTMTASDYLAKAYGAYHQLLGHGDDSAVIVVYTAKDQADGAEAVLDYFLKNNYMVINKLLLKTKQNQ